MKAHELISKIESGALNSYAALWSDLPREAKRFTDAIGAFCDLYGDDHDLMLFSVPGRSELSGNHTDHQRGKVLAGAIDRDIIAVAAKTGDGVIRLKSEGFPEDVVPLADVCDKNAFSQFSSRALIGGTCRAFLDRGETLGGFAAYTTTDVKKGSGISSSAAFEVMVGHILNRFFCAGRYPATELAKIAQFAENEYFGKPCGLMDQMACAVGGFVGIDFGGVEPVVTPIGFSLSDAGYRLAIVHTGGNHADLNDEYAAVPAEMKAVAEHFGQKVLRGITEDMILRETPALRSKTGDRAILRALHFVRENERVTRQTEALSRGDLPAFLRDVKASGRSSFCYLQNVYAPKNPVEQGLSLALCVTEGFLADRQGAWRVHGGGFAGTIQAFVRAEDAEDYRRRMDGIFGEGATMMLSIRPVGATVIDLSDT